MHCKMCCCAIFIIWHQWPMFLCALDNIDVRHKWAFAIFKLRMKCTYILSCIGPLIFTPPISGESSQWLVWARVNMKWTTKQNKAFRLRNGLMNYFPPWAAPRSQRRRVKYSKLPWPALHQNLVLTYKKVCRRHMTTYNVNSFWKIFAGATAFSLVVC